MGIVFPDFSKSSVLVVGDVMLDRYYYGSVSRISPEAPVPIIDVNMIENRPGGAANVAMNVAALGANTKLISILGTDDDAQLLKDKLNLSNIECNFFDTNSPTIVKLRIFSHNQQLFRLDFEKGYKNIDVFSIIECVKLELSYVNVLIISDYGKGLLGSCIEEIIDIANKLSIQIIVDPKKMNFLKYQGATLLTPNLSEFNFLTGCYHTKEDILVSSGMKILLQYRLSAMLITCSEHGMILFQKEKKPLHFPPQAKNVCDVTGAGDTVVGVLAASLSSGKTLEESCFLANMAAGLVVAKLGTSVVYSDELQNVFNNSQDIIFGIVDEEQLVKNINLIRRKGEKIVMTNGVFDIIHAGHITYLIKAKQLGDRLVVAVNSDDSTRRLKGKNRPINSLEHRMLVLSSLEMVDWVVPFYEDSPKRLITHLLPDVLVKGGDYKSHTIDGGHEVLESGGQVYTLDFELDCSTTKMVDFLNK